MSDLDAFLASQGVDLSTDSLAHAGVKGMRWGVRKDEKPLSDADKALNMSQRTQVRVASTISAVAAVGMASNAAAALFQLQSRFEHLRILNEAQKYAENSPFIDEAGREALRRTRSHIIKGLIGSALGATAIATAVGVVTRRTAKAYFAPLHKVYGDQKPKINRELNQLSRDIKKGKRPSLTAKQYETEVTAIINKHMTKDANNAIRPFHELARHQLGTELDTKSLKIKIEKLPNTDLASKMTITTPHGLKLVKAIKNVKHAETDDDPLAPDMELFFDYKFDSDGHVVEWSCPTIEIADDLFEGRLNISELEKKFDPSAYSMSHSDPKEVNEIKTYDTDAVDSFIAHVGPKARERTLQDVFDGLSAEHRDLQDLIVGAAISDESLAGDPLIREQYEALPVENKALIDFLVGNIAAERGVQHAEESAALTFLDGFESNDSVEAFLEHVGVKGMRWGVRKADTPWRLSREANADAKNYGYSDSAKRAARDNVRGGAASLGSAHLAAVKSTGHRAINAFTGDKTFWKRMAVTAGITGGVALASAAVPLVLPAGMMSSFGASLASAGGAQAFAGHVLVDGSLWTTAEYGRASATALGWTAAGIGAGAVAVKNVASNTARAVRGNSRIDKSFEKLGDAILKRQTEGSMRVNKILRENGSIRKSDLTHTDLELVESFLAHIDSLETEDEVDTFLAHYGVKGMRWGVRRSLEARTVAKLAKGQAKLNAKTAAEQAKLDAKAMEAGYIRGGSAGPKADEDPIEVARVAADVERLIRTTSKPGHEMSTDEIKSAVARAKIVKDYDAIFNPQTDPNRDLAIKVQALKLEREYSQIKAAARGPSALSRVTKLITATATGGFSAFQTLDNATGGAISSNIKGAVDQALGQTSKPKHRGTPQGKRKKP